MAAKIHIGTEQTALYFKLVDGYCNIQTSFGNTKNLVNKMSVSVVESSDGFFMKTKQLTVIFKVILKYETDSLTNTVKISFESKDIYFAPA